MTTLHFNNIFGKQLVLCESTSERVHRSLSSAPKVIVTVLGPIKDSGSEEISTHARTVLYLKRITDVGM